MMRKHFLRFCLLVLVSLGVAAVHDVQHVSAVNGTCFFTSTAGPIGSTGGCSESGFGDYGTNDVLTGRSTSGAGEAIPDSVNNKEDFIKFVKKRLSSNNTQDKIGAAFIIQTLHGERTWPSSGDVAEWEELMRLDNVTFQRYPVKIWKTSWYDDDKRNTFYDYYEPGNRESIIIKQNGVVKGVIETGCGNLANKSIKIDEPDKWGDMKATTSVNKTEVKPGQVVKWTHTVWNSGNRGKERSEKITGHIWWAGGTSGRLPADTRARAAGELPSKAQNNNNNIGYDRRFYKGKSPINDGQHGWQRVYAFTVPGNAQKGDRYCQYVNGDKTAWNNNKDFKSTKKCVKVVDEPTTPGGADSATCEPVTISLTGPIEVESYPYEAGYKANVSTTRTKPDDRSGWKNVSDTQQRQTEKRYYYEMKDAEFGSDHGPSSDGGKATISANPHPGTPATGKLPATSETTFDYEWEDQAGKYTVDGDFEATVVEVRETYERFRTRSRTAHYDADGKFTHYTYGNWRSPGGWSLSNTKKDDVGAVNAHCPESPQLTYAYRPYMTVYGDVLAGAYQNDLHSTTCTSVGSAGIYGWNHNDGNGPDEWAAVYHNARQNDLAGAGAEAGAFALANIKLFSSALNHNGVAPIDLSFANNSTNPANGEYGGNFGNLPVGCNFVPEADEAATSGFPSGGNSAYNDNKTYVINGSVTISGDIIYANNGGWAATRDIPRLKLVVVGGDIRINGSVGQLDGMYVAIPNGASGGNIYTCAENNYNDCNNQLTVYGSFIAKKIHFGRTSGTLHEANPSDTYQSSPAGENFIYTPELWLPKEAGRNSLEYDSILGLPPVL